MQSGQAQLMPPEAVAAMRLRFTAGAGGFPLVGTAEQICERLELLTWVDYDDGLARFNADVLPLLEKSGLREPFRPNRPEAK